MISRGKMVETVNAVYTRFVVNAKNHGNGNNWWYPKPYVVAYNVKMRSFADIEQLKKHMTVLQKRYYKDNMLDDLIELERERTCEDLVETIQNKYGLTAYFAGRSGGWLEVEYKCDVKHLDALDSDEEDIGEVCYHYHNAVSLTKEEAAVERFITSMHKSYNKYVGSEMYYYNIVNNLMLDDNDINYIGESMIEDAKALTFAGVEDKI